MSFDLPLFPLGVVLFPGAPLQLHVFEPRYRLMMKRVLEADRTFGIALMIEGREGEPGTIPAACGCAAEVTEVAPFPDGRLNAETVGRRRFRILSTREEDDYLVGTCEWLDDEPCDLELARPIMRRVHAALYRYVALVAEGAGAPPPPFDLHAPREPEAFSMWVAALLNAPDDQKQELLESVSTVERLARELILLQRAQVVQQAWLKRQMWLQANPPEDAPPDEIAPFLSPN